MSLFEWHGNMINNYPLISTAYYCLIFFVFKDKWFPTLKDIKEQNINSSNWFLGLMWLSTITICIYSFFNKEDLIIGFTGSFYFLITIIFWIELIYRKVKINKEGEV